MSDISVFVILSSMFIIPQRSIMKILLYQTLIAW